MLNERKWAEASRLFATSKAKITWRANGGPVRNVHKRGKRKPIGRYPSLKVGRSLLWESVHERQMMWICEADAGIVRYADQPNRLAIRDPDDKTKEFLYVPDLLIGYADGRDEIVEVKKNARELDPDEYPDYVRKLERAAEIYRSQGFHFRVAVAEIDILLEPMLSNANAIQSCRFTKVDTLARLRFHEAITTAGGSLTLGEAVEILSPTKSRFDPHAAALVKALIVRREASVDLRMALDFDAKVSVVKKSGARQWTS